MKNESLQRLIGTTLADRYAVDSLIGVGGMGAVFRATGDAGEQVALKIVLPDRLADGGTIVPRFLREARLAARIEHPHVVRTLDFGRWGERRDRYYLAMELVDGLPLGALVDLPLPAGVAVALMCQLLEALAHVHAREILHRDIKPDNLLVVREPDGRLVIKVTDFGVAAALGEATSTRLTVEGGAVGTPAYMAPEQALAVCMPGPPLDLYPVGVVLFRLLSGRLPFDGPMTRVMYAKVTEDPPLPDAHDGSALPTPLVEAIRRLLARQPEDRYAMAADVLADLRPLAVDPVLEAPAWLECGGRVSTPQDDVATTLDAPPPAPPRARVERQSPLWGRGGELAALEAVAEEAEAGEGRIVVIAGEAGLGKSRLLEELAVRMGESGRFHLLRCAFHGSSGGLESFRASVDRLLGSAGRPRAEVVAIAREWLRRHGESDDDEVEELVSFLRPPVRDQASEGASLRSRHFALLLRMMRRIARVRPLLVAVDDFDHGGEDSAALLEYLLFECGYEPFPMLMLATTRGGNRSRRFEQGLARTDRFEGISRHVLPLKPVGLEALAAGLAATEGLSTEAATAVARRSGGNPLFAIQLARAGEAAITLTRTDTFTGSALELPAPLRRVLETSLAEKLATAEGSDQLRDLLVRLAILGDRVELPLLEAMLQGEPAEDLLDDHLDALLDLGVLTEEVDGRTERIGFAQGLTRDALLAGLSSRRGRRLHRRAASVRVELGSHAGPIGDHLEAAGDATAAVEHWLRAMSEENAAGNFARGLAWGRRALAELDRSDPRWARAAIRLGRLLLDVGDLDAAEELLEPVLEDADVDLALEGGDVLCEVLENRAAGERWTALVERLGGLESRAGPPGLRALGRARSLWFNTQVRPAEAMAAARAALEGAVKDWEIQRGAQRMAFAGMISGDMETARAAARTSVEHAGERSYLRARALRTLTIVAGNSDDGPGALAAAEEELELVRRSGQATRLAIALGDVGYALEILGETERARESHAASMRAARQVGLEGPALYAEFRLLALELTHGDPDTVTAERIEAFADRAEAAGLELLALARRPMLAWLACSSGRPLAAYEELVELEFLERFPRFHYLGECLQGIGVRLAEVGEPEAARQTLDRARAYWEGVGNRRRAAECGELAEGVG